MKEDNIPRAAGKNLSFVTPSAWEAMREKVEGLEVIPSPKDFDVSRRGKKTFFRLRPPGQGVRSGPPAIPPFLLGAHTGGARIYKGELQWYVTTLTFEKKFIYDVDGNLLEDVNGLVEQAEIEGLQTMGIGAGSSEAPMEESSSGEPEDDWMDLDWFGDVWAVVELDGETGKPTALTIEGPEEPAMIPIPTLNEDLSRGSQSGSGSGGRVGWAVKIGTVPETGQIVQERTGNLPWFLAFVPEAESSSSSGSSSSGSSESSSSSGQSSSGRSSSGGSGSSKDTAIVPTPWGYRKWYAMESAQVLFFDFMEVEARRGENCVAIDPMVLHCTERGTLRAFASPERGHAVARIEDDVLVVDARHWPWPRTQRVQVMLKGIRRGFARVRTEKATMEEYIANEMRLCPKKTREDVMAEIEGMPLQWKQE